MNENLLRPIHIPECLLEGTVVPALNVYFRDFTGHATFVENFPKANVIPGVADQTLHSVYQKICGHEHNTVAKVLNQPPQVIPGHSGYDRQPALSFPEVQALSNLILRELELYKFNPDRTRQITDFIAALRTTTA